MSLKPIVRACGGDLYAGGRRANIPAPGHGARDRSISLWVVDGRVIVHSFGGADSREALDMLRGLGLIDDANRLRGAAGSLLRPVAADPAPRERQAAACALWSTAGSVSGRLSEAYLRRRGVTRPLPGPWALRHHGGVPIAVYGRSRMAKPALLAAIQGPAGELTGVEVTYLDPGGRRARWPTLSRKTIGLAPAGSAVRLDAIGPELLVAEGVVTALSASELMALPAWALLSTRNLRAWTAPEGLSRVTIAADRGADGERSAQMLAARLQRGGLAVRLALPPPGCGDWNDAAVIRAPAKSGGEGGGGRADGGDGPRPARESPR